MIPQIASWLCSWCQKFYDAEGYINNPGTEPEMVSHGICRECSEKEIAKLREMEVER